MGLQQRQIYFLACKLFWIKNLYWSWYLTQILLKSDMIFPPPQSAPRQVCRGNWAVWFIHTSGFGPVLLRTCKGSRTTPLWSDTGCGVVSMRKGDALGDLTPQQMLSHTCWGWECFSLWEGYTEHFEHPGVFCLWWITANFCMFQSSYIRNVAVLACWAAATRNAMQSQF